MEPLAAVRAWRRLANGVVVNPAGTASTWAQYINGPGHADEERLIQPIVFPRFADELLGFKVGETLAPEIQEGGLKPDFTPADAVSHSFVFETKPTNQGPELLAAEQVGRYLREGAPRIRRVVLTNLVGLRVFELIGGEVELVLDVNLRGLLAGPAEAIAATGNARRFAQFLTDYRFVELTREEKVARVRAAPPWNPVFEVTSPDWLTARLDRVVELLRSDARRQIAAGALTDVATMTAVDQEQVVNELREIEWRLSDAPLEGDRTLDSYLGAPESSAQQLALQQYQAHVAYFAATRLLLVRIWEDLGILDGHLHDGGFDDWMNRLDGVLSEVVERSYRRAQQRYPSLFDRRNSYTWYQPSEEAYADVIYELANTYFGAIQTDVLGAVYASLLERVDRKLLGQYYTPRDVIRAMWDMLNLTALADSADRQDEAVIVVDIATGSGGFLVEAGRRLRERYEEQRVAGAGLLPGTWAERVAQGLVGVEIQRFPAYLAEVNLLIQLALLRTTEEAVRIPALSILWADTLGLHNPHGFGLGEAEPPDLHGINTIDDARRTAYQRLKNPTIADARWADVAIGNPPYVGEKKAATTMARTREVFPYWNRFVGPHQDYLYWFLILGVSKLRQGGRFAFITTEYWLRADGARPLRQYLAERCSIERILLFRDMRLFPDAPGQHSMVIVGERLAPADPEVEGTPMPVAPARPRVSIFRGAAGGPRREVLEALKEGRTAYGVDSFQATASPNELGGGTWATVTLTDEQIRRRAAVADAAEPLRLTMEEGVISGVDRLTANDAPLLTGGALAALGGARPGIFALTAQEVRQLGDLNDRERQVVRPIINTSDVYPYGAVTAADSRFLLYLPQPPRPAGATIDALQAAPAPDWMPRIAAHLSQFQPLLLAKVRNYGERRPWWSIHRARARTFEQEGTHGRWAGYALTTRWGGGGRLLVGLAPRGVVPASGLHSVWPEEPATAAYLVALMNASYVQELADTLPPGEIRQTDIADLRLPAFAGETALTMARHGTDLADIVQALITTHGPRFPKLPDALRTDIGLADAGLDAWIPEQGPQARWGVLPHVAWVRVVETSGPQADRIEGVEIERGIFGLSVVARGRRTGLVRVTLEVDAEPLAEALAAYARGQMARRQSLRDFAAAAVPIDAEAAPQTQDADRLAASTLVDRYRQLRRDVDDLVAEFM